MTATPPHARTRSYTRAAARTAAVVTFAAPAHDAVAQPLGGEHAHGRPVGITLRASGIGLLTRQDPGPLGETYTEGYLTQPVVGLDVAVFRGRGFLTSTLNLEGLTLRRGQLNTGAFGEGYADRRHPHTYVHELIIGARGRLGDVRASIAGGKGFAPFGSDDPMVRELVSFPVNHHLSHVPERLVAIAAAEARGVTAEVGVFNGDEPTGPGSWPNAERFGDSWAARLTLRARHPAELAGSYASVVSPDFRLGSGLDQRKWNAALAVTPCSAQGARARRPTCRISRILAEWGRTVEYEDDTEALAYSTGLIEVAAPLAGVDGTIRLERTTRPEEERTLDPFRTPRPPPDFRSAGRTRWHVVTLQVRRVTTLVKGRIVPLVEGSLLWPEQRLRGSLFAPRAFYGRTRLASMSIGLKAAFGHEHSRMGRYGAALPND